MTVYFRLSAVLPKGLPEPRLSIINFNSVVEAFQDLRYIGELRQRWNEIKKLQYPPSLSTM